jgi:hypothetical protein
MDAAAAHQRITGAWQKAAPLAFLSLGLLACETAGFKDTYMALDATGNRKRTVFFTDTESIYCVAEMASGVDDVTVTAKLRARTLYDEFTGQPYALGTIIGVEEQAPGAGTDITVSFQVEKPDGSDTYPAGRLTCELYLDGKLESELDFEVRYPNCPFEPIEPESSCAGVVLRGARCPSPSGGSCTCGSESGLWACE